MTIDSFVLDMVVIGKDKREEGFIFKSTNYYLALKITDDRVRGNPTTERMVPFNQFCQVDVGDTVPIRMYTPNGHTWYFSEDEAREA